MKDYFVIIKSKLREANSILGINTEYEVDAHILYENKDGRDIYKDVVIKFFGRPPEQFFIKLCPGRECLLVLKHESDNTFICDGAYWYIENKKILSFKDNTEISPTIVFRDR